MAELSQLALQASRTGSVSGQQFGLPMVCQKLQASVNATESQNQNCPTGPTMSAAKQFYSVAV